MNFDPFFIWLESTALSQWVVGSPSLLAFPGILTLHAIGMGFAVGGVMEGDGLQYYSDVEDKERRDRAASYLRALREECSIMARCTGKTNVQNLEPEDLRSISIATARATGVPLAGMSRVP